MNPSVCYTDITAPRGAVPTGASMYRGSTEVTLYKQDVVVGGQRGRNETIKAWYARGGFRGDILAVGEKADLKAMYPNAQVVEF